MWEDQSGGRLFVPSFSRVSSWATLATKLASRVSDFPNDMMGNSVESLSKRLCLAEKAERRVNPLQKKYNSLTCLSRPPCVVFSLCPLFSDSFHSSRTTKESTKNTPPQLEQEHTKHASPNELVSLFSHQARIAETELLSLFSFPQPDNFA